MEPVGLSQIDTVTTAFSPVNVSEPRIVEVMIGPVTEPTDPTLKPLERLPSPSIERTPGAC